MLLPAHLAPRLQDHPPATTWAGPYVTRRPANDPNGRHMPSKPRAKALTRHRPVGPEQPGTPTAPAGQT
jgi:hypothetical protein